MEKSIEYIGKCLLLKNVGEQKNESVLVVGDLHLGYEEAMNRTGVFVTRQMFEELLSDLAEILGESGRVDKIILLGDVKHEFGRTSRQEWSDVLKLFEYLEDKCDELVVIKGNHDNMLPGVARQRDIGLVDHYILDDIAFFHGDKDFPEINEKKIKLWVLGHLHPAFNLSDGVKVEKYKCYLEGKYRGKRVIIMPSFSEYNEGTDIARYERELVWDFRIGGFRVKAVGDNLEVLDFGLLKRID